MGILNLESGALLVTAALKTSRSAYAMIFLSFSSTLKFILGFNGQDIFHFRPGLQACGKTLGVGGCCQKGLYFILLFFGHI